MPKAGEGGESTRRRITLSRKRGGGGMVRVVSPENFFLLLSASMCAFFGAFVTGFQSFWSQILLEKIFLDAQETRCWTKYFSYSHDFHLFLQHVYLRLFHLLAKSLILALTLACTSKTLVFEKIHLFKYNTH